MFLESNFTELFEKADNQCKQKLAAALGGIQPDGEALSFEVVLDLYATAEYQAKAFYIEDGAISQVLDGRALFHHDTGDIIGLDTVDGKPQATFKTESPVVLRPYHRDSLLKATTASAEKFQQWADYLIAECARYTSVIASLEAPEDRASLGFQSFAPGDVIIEEGTESDSVYSIVEGHAYVLVNGIKVGEVLKDEIFGAMSLLTDSLRTATVIADAQCLVMVVPKAQFQTLIQTHPKICLNLMENMARQIVALNSKVASSQNL